MINKFYSLLGQLLCPGCWEPVIDYEQYEDGNLWCCHNERCGFSTFDPEYAAWWPLSYPKYLLKHWAWGFGL